MRACMRANDRAIEGLDLMVGRGGCAWGGTAFQGDEDCRCSCRGCVGLVGEEVI